MVVLTRRSVRVSQGLLCCPHCDGDYLHQRRVEVFNREEDADTGTHVVVRGDQVSVDRSLAGNPSMRRDGIRLGFECELCEAGASLVLVIVQHKGQTEINWEV